MPPHRLSITVRVRQLRFFVQATNQDEFEAFAETRLNFFLRAVDAQLTFEKGPDGKVASLILHQDGCDLRGERVP